MVSPVDATLHFNHVKKWYERCPKSMADAKIIADMWAKVSREREMEDPRAHIGQAPPSASPAAGSVPCGPTATGSNAGRQHAAAAPPPHAPGEGSTSSGSGTPAAAQVPADGTPKADQTKATTGKPAKRARRAQSAAPTVGRKEGLQEPLDLVFADGRSESNLRLLHEWQAYVDALVADCPIMVPADAASFMADLRAGVENGTAILAQRIEEERVHNWNLQHAVLYPVQRPDNGRTPVQDRWTPLAKKPQAPPTT